MKVRLLIAAAVLATAAPALAHPMDGAGIPTNDWGDEHLLCRASDCTGEISQGNVVGVWQAILWTETYLAECGSSGVDGWFGTVTKNATKDLQTYWGLTVDGKVGPQTWGRADNNVVDGENNKAFFYYADRSAEDLLFYRLDGIYFIFWRDYPATPYAMRHTDHYDRSIDVC